jgi:hypothetical protein
MRLLLLRLVQSNQACTVLCSDGSIDARAVAAIVALMLVAGVAVAL